MTSGDRLRQTVSDFLTVGGDIGALLMLDTHPELLSDRAEELVSSLIAEAFLRGYTGDLRSLERRRQLLRRSREIGPQATFIEMGTQHLEELAQALNQFINASTAAELRTVLETHPELVGDNVFAMLKKAIADMHARGSEYRARHMEARYQLLRRCQQVGAKQALAEQASSP